MSELSKELQTYIVQQLAMYSTPQEIVELVKKDFEEEVSRQQVFYYNADMNPKLPKKWREIFEATRKKFLKDTASIPIAGKSFRLRELDKIYHNQKSAKTQNTKAMKDTLEQAAKESGDAFTNRRELSGVNGEPIQHSVVRVPAKISPEEWKQQSQFQPATEIEQ